MNLQPLNEKVIIEPLKEEQKSDTGLVVPEAAQQGFDKGKVVAVGEGKYEDGHRIPLSVKVGDTVLYKQYTSDEIEVDSKKYHILNEFDIFAILKK